MVASNLGSKLSKEALIKNDYYSLYKTFELIIDEFNYKFDKFSNFRLLVQQLEDIDTPLSNKIAFWKDVLDNGNDII